jgi:hypothetical protein
MSHSFNNRDFKVHYKDYLRHSDEPEEAGLYDNEPSAKFEAGLIRNNFYERRRLRRTAMGLRRAF